MILAVLIQLQDPNGSETDTICQWIEVGPILQTMLWSIVPRTRLDRPCIGSTLIVLDRTITTSAAP